MHRVFQLVVKPRGLLGIPDEEVLALDVEKHRHR